jgi:adenylate kinase
VYVVLIGAPGAGKGTQAVWLSEGFGMTHVASGDMFRDAIGRGTLRGLQAKAYMDRGELVPDDVTTAMVVERLGQPDIAKGALLDGYPRTLPQAKSLDTALRSDRRRVEQAIYLSVPGDELLRRLAGRWLCRKCQASYHEVFNPPKVPGVCDRCGGELYQRPDDTRETAQRRLEVYFEQTTPVVGYYRDAGVLDEVDGARGIEDVRDAIFRAVRRRQEQI